MQTTRTTPKLGDVRYVVTWIDQDAMQASAKSEDDLVERLHDAERAKTFSKIESAKRWAEANTNKDHYGEPRLEKLTFGRKYDELPPEWIRSEYQEWSEGAWSSIYG